MTEVNLRPKSVPSANGEPQLFARKIDVRRVQEARNNRALQLKAWEEYDRQMTISEHGNNSSRLSKHRKHVIFQPNYVLFDAVLTNDYEQARYLLEVDHLDPDLSKEDGLTSLHQACINQNIEIISLLIRNKADVNCRDADLWTPLHASANCGHIEGCQYLIDHGADLLASNIDGVIPVDLAEDDEETYLFLLNELEQRGYTNADLESARMESEQRMLDDLSRNRRTMNINGLDSQGAAPLHIAATWGYIDVATALLRMNANPDQLDSGYWTPAHVASVWGQVEVLKILVAFGADLTKGTPEGYTAFDLCDQGLHRLAVEEIWDNREALIRAVKAEHTPAPKPMQRKRSSSSIHRHSLNEKSAYSKQEMLREARLAELTKLNMEGSNDDLYQPFEGKKTILENGKTLIIVHDRVKSAPDPDNSTPKSSPQIRHTGERIILIRPPTGYDMVHRDSNSPTSSQNHDSYPKGNVKKRVEITDHRNPTKPRSIEIPPRGSTIIPRARSPEPYIPPQEIEPRRTLSPEPAPHPGTEGTASNPSICGDANCCQSCAIL